MDRRLAGGGTLFNAAEDFAVAGTRKIKLPARQPDRAARTATLQIRFGEVDICRPRDERDRTLPPLRRRCAGVGLRAVHGAGQDRDGCKVERDHRVPKLLAILSLKGRIVTIDARNCQRAMAKQIIDENGHYALALKAKPDARDSANGRRRSWADRDPHGGGLGRPRLVAEATQLARSRQPSRKSSGSVRKPIKPRVSGPAVLILPDGWF